MAKKLSKKVPERTAELVASELLEVRTEMNLLRQSDKALSEELKKLMSEGQIQDTYGLVPSTSLKIKDYLKVLAWAQKFVPRALTVDTKAARAAFMGDLKGEFGTPEANGFQLVVVESLKELKVKDGDPEKGYDIA